MLALREVMAQQVTGSARLTKASTIQSPEKPLAWTCPYCNSEVRPFTGLDGQAYRTPHCLCNESYAARQLAAITPSARQEMILRYQTKAGATVETGITAKMRDKWSLNRFDPRAKSIKNGMVALKAVESFCELAPSNEADILVLSGVYGVGKSMLAVGAAMRLIYRKVMTCYYADFLTINQKLMADNRTVDHYAELMKRCGVLVIDDLDKESPGKQSTKLLLSVLSHRLNNYNKVTIITMNHGLSELHGYLSLANDEGVSDKSAAIIRRINDGVRFNVPIIGNAFEVNHV